MDQIPQEEKIDYIYTTLKKQEARYRRKLYFKVMLVLLFIWYAYYSYMILYPVIQRVMWLWVMPSLDTGMPQESMVDTLMQWLKQKDPEELKQLLGDIMWTTHSGSQGNNTY